jgi:hypothetical protein
MGIIINMPRKSVETLAIRNDIPDTGARILLFTGVRYERYEDSPLIVKTDTPPIRTRRRRA